MHIKTITITAVAATGSHPVIELRGKQSRYYFFREGTEFTRLYTEEPNGQGQFPLAQAREDLFDLGNSSSPTRVTWLTVEEHSEFVKVEAERIAREEAQEKEMAELRARVEQENADAAAVVQQIREQLAVGPCDHPDGVKILQLVDQGISAREAVSLFAQNAQKEEPTPETESPTEDGDEPTNNPEPAKAPAKRRTPKIAE